MPAKRGEKRAIRRAERVDAHRKRLPQQPDGMPRGKHLTGFKGMKVDSDCNCGGCSGKKKINS